MLENNYVRSISFRESTLQKAEKILVDRLVPGINNRSALVEYALQKVFAEVFKGGSS